MKHYPSIRPTVTPLNLAQLLDATSSQLGSAHFIPARQGQTPTSVEVSGVTVNTADIDVNWAFVAVPGERHHGARFAKQAGDSGASVIVTDQAGADRAEKGGVPILVVEDPRKSAGFISAALYGPLDMTLVGVTGTNGKTTTTYFMRAALEPEYGHSAVFGTVELDTGHTKFSNGSRTTQESPVSHRTLALAAQQGTKAAVLEVSSHALSLDRVQGLTFDLSVFVNLQHDHLDYYKTMDRYLEAKALLFKNGVSKRAVIGVDDKYGRHLVKNLKIPVVGVQVLTDDNPGLGDTPVWKAHSIQPDAESGGSRFKLVSPDGHEHNALSPIPGRGNVQDAAVSLVAATNLGVSIGDAIEALRVAPPVPGRMQWIPTDTRKQPKVLVDYAHTPEGVEILLDVVRESVEGRIIAVFGTDGDRDATKRCALAQTFALKADVLWVTDENPRWEDPVAIRSELLEGIRTVRPNMENVVEVATSRRDAMREAIRMGNPGDVVIITGKGSEPFQENRGVFHTFLDSEEAEEIVRNLAKA